MVSGAVVADPDLQAGVVVPVPPEIGGTEVAGAAAGIATMSVMTYYPPLEGQELPVAPAVGEAAALEAGVEAEGLDLHQPNLMLAPMEPALG